MTGMTVQVDPGLVEPIVRAEIEAAIVTQLQKNENLIPKLVQAALADKVNERGVKGQYNSDNRYLFIDVLCRDAIQEAARAAMKEYIEEHKEALKAELARQLREKTTTGELARIFVESLAGALSAGWRFEVKVELPGQRG